MHSLKQPCMYHSGSTGMRYISGVSLYPIASFLFSVSWNRQTLIIIPSSICWKTVYFAFRQSHKFSKQILSSPTFFIRYFLQLLFIDQGFSCSLLTEMHFEEHFIFKICIFPMCMPYMHILQTCHPHKDEHERILKVIWSCFCRFHTKKRPFGRLHMGWSPLNMKRQRWV